MNGTWNIIFIIWIFSVFIKDFFRGFPEFISFIHCIRNWSLISLIPQVQICKRITVLIFKVAWFHHHIVPKISPSCLVWIGSGLLLLCLNLLALRGLEFLLKVSGPPMSLLRWPTNLGLFGTFLNFLPRNLLCGTNWYFLGGLEVKWFSLYSTYKFPN